MAETRIYNEQLKEYYIKNERINIANGVAGLDDTTKLPIALIPTHITDTIDTATLTTRGVTTLSNSYTGTLQTVAVTEKALSDGLASVRTFYTIVETFRQSTGDITTGQSVISLSASWPTSDIFGITIYRNGLYKNKTLDFTVNSMDKTLTLVTPVAANDIISVVFDCLLNAEVIEAANCYNKIDIDQQMSLKANIDSPSLTGIPLSITNSTVKDNSNQIATDAFVNNAFTYYLNNIRITVGNTEPTSPTTGDLWVDTNIVA